MQSQCASNFVGISCFKHVYAAVHKVGFIKSFFSQFDVEETWLACTEISTTPGMRMRAGLEPEVDIYYQC